MTNENIVPIYQEGEIDIHKRKSKFQRSLEKLRQDKQINSENKKLIQDFIRDCQLGKTVKHKRKKKIGPARCLKYIRVLLQLSKIFSKSFNHITQKEMEDYIYGLENDSIISLRGKPYSDSTKLDIKNTIRKFWKWKDGNNSVYPEIVEWIDTYIESKDVLIITREEVEKLIERTSSIRNKAILMILFDSGARINELLNVRLKKEHIFWKEKIGCYMLRLEYSKTKSRTISVPLSTKYLKNWLDEHPAKANPQAQLFPMNYDCVRMAISRLGKRILKKRVTPHLLRHSSATFYANKLSRYQLCYRYGWAMSSNMPDRYIDREGLMEADTAQAVQYDEISKAKNESHVLKEQMTLLKQSHSDLNKRFEGVQKELDKVKSGKGIMSILMTQVLKQKKMSEVLDELENRKFDVVLQRSEA